MDDGEWGKHRNRIILAAFQTGRPVFGDSDGTLRFADGDQEPLDPDVGLPRQDLPTAAVNASWWARLKRWL